MVRTKEQVEAELKEVRGKKSPLYKREGELQEELKEIFRQEELKRGKVFSKKSLLKLPFRSEDKHGTVYDSLLLVPDGTKHESGWMNIAVIGCKEDEPLHICSYADDLVWKFENTPHNEMRTDCLYPQGTLRFWGCKFKVGYPTSSTDILVISRKGKE